MRYDGATRGLTIFGSKRQLMVVRSGGMIEGAKLNWPELRRISAYQPNLCWYERYTILWSFGFCLSITFAANHHITVGRQKKYFAP